MERARAPATNTHAHTTKPQPIDMYIDKVPYIGAARRHCFMHGGATTWKRAQACSTKRRHRPMPRRNISNSSPNCLRHTCCYYPTTWDPKILRRRPLPSFEALHPAHNTHRATTHTQERDMRQCKSCDVAAVRRTKKRWAHVPVTLHVARKPIKCGEAYMRAHASGYGSAY